MATKLQQMNNADLEREQLRLQKAEEKLRTEKKAIQDEFNRRAAEATVSGMTDAEKAALVQTLTAEGIDSEEAAGKPS